MSISRGVLRDALKPFITLIFLTEGEGDVLVTADIIWYDTSKSKGDVPCVQVGKFWSEYGGSGVGNVACSCSCNGGRKCSTVAVVLIYVESNGTKSCEENAKCRHEHVQCGGSK